MSNEVFEQHDDPDVIIPDKIARPLVYTAHLLLANAIVSLCLNRYGLFAVLLFVYITSIFHWRKPRFSSIARLVDYFAVLAAVLYGTFYLLYDLRHIQKYDLYLLIWFIGLSITSIVFIFNESSYYIQVMKLPNGSSTMKYNEMQDVEAVRLEWNSNVVINRCLPRSLPNTPERDAVYKRVVFIHLLCIHVFTNVLAFILITQLF